MNYYNEIKEQLIKSEIYDKVKDYAKDKNKVKVYYEIGRLLSKAGKEYGKNIIKNYSEKLVTEVGKKYNERTLRKYRQFYEIFSKQKWSTMWTKLCWSHYREVLSIKNINEIIYYLNECENKNLSQRQLHELIKHNTYDRLNENTKNKLINKEQLNMVDLIPNPIIINKNVKDEMSEYALKQSILNNLDKFLRQLGNYFTYLGNEYPIKLGDRYNYIDLLLYNIKYKCYVVIELKVTELKKEHTGQIQTYMNYIDDNLKTIDENKTVGIIISKQDNEYIIKYCSDERIVSRVYKIVC